MADAPRHSRPQYAGGVRRYSPLLRDVDDPPRCNLPRCGTITIPTGWAEWVPAHDCWYVVFLCPVGDHGEMLVWSERFDPIIQAAGLSPDAP